VTRICYVIPSLNVGGTEKQLLALIEELVHDHEVTVVCTNDAGAFGGDARRLGAYVRELHLRGGWNFRMRSRLRRVFRSHRPDVLHTFLFGFDYQANLAARDTGVPVVISSRRQLATWKKRRHIRLQRKANRLVDCVVANSQAVANYAIDQENADPALFRVIPNGVDVDAFKTFADPDHVRARYGIPPKKRVVGIVANFSPVKDYPFFGQIAIRLLERRHDVHFLAVGSGPLLKRVQQLFKVAGLNDYFTQIATLSKMADVYSIMDVSVLCSISEGCPNAVMEAMAARRPVVAANVGGVPEIIQDGETGRLIDGHDPKLFAEAIDALLSDEREAQRMGAAAQTYVREHLSMERMADAYRKLYAELLIRTSRNGA
jgi:glycosyltransferase involved in cell wall biosynthesis